jgi:hypothetical protein
MNKSLLIVAISAIVGIGGIWAISPLFTNTTVNEALPNSDIPSKIEDKDALMANNAMMEEKAMMEETKLTYTGTFVGVGDGIHDAQGTAKIISLDSGNNILRLEDFKSTNGPDLYVYLATNEKASEFVSLGKLKANNGNQNYEIPQDTDLEKYNQVLIWCKTFGVLFGNADLSST